MQIPATSLRRALAALALLATTALCAAGLPLSYYDAATSAPDPTALRDSLHQLITSGSVALGYDNTWDPLRFTDESPTSTGAVQLIYGAVSRDKYSGYALDKNPLTGGWNREHAFPQSFFNQAEPMRSDLHALFPADSDINTSRSNSAYDTVTTPTYTDALGNRATSALFEPCDADKGRVARALLYMEVRYDGTAGEPDLTLINSYPAGTGAGQMAYLSTLLQWNQAHPPTAFERARNYRVYALQQNSNPFIDHPEWVTQLFGGPTYAIHSGDHLTVSADATGAPASAHSGDAAVPLLSLTASVTGQEVALAGFTVHQLGTLPASHIGPLNLWYDADLNGVVTPADCLLATGTLDQSFADLNIARNYPRTYTLSTGENHLLITAPIDWDSPTSATIQLELADPANANEAIRLNLAGGTDTATVTANSAGPIFTITNPLDDLQNLHITEIFEGTSGNLKYLELWNNSPRTIDFTADAIQLRRYTNGSTAPLTITPPNLSIAAGGVIVIANNAADFQQAFSQAPNYTTAEISHNGNDYYDLLQTSSSLVLDSFAADRIGNANSINTDRAVHRVINLLPSPGHWGPGTGLPVDGSYSSSGQWYIRTISPNNANAQSASSPGSLTLPTSAIPTWPSY